MKSTTKKLSFRFFLRISVVSLICLIFSMIFIMRHSYITTAENQNLINESIELISAATLLQKGSDELTENIWLFVSTKDEKFAQKYIDEAYKKRLETKGWKF